VGEASLFQIGTYPGAQAFTSNGARADGMNYFLDGGNNLDPYTNVNNSFPNPDALEQLVFKQTTSALKMAVLPVR